MQPSSGIAKGREKEGRKEGEGGGGRREAFAPPSQISVLTQLSLALKQ